ncbi:MAG: Transcription elongation factor GreA [Candidatus Nomurabacteria bacterium GW2011_GWA2_40_9]|uniref:Transcription elongation factor GreA n=1 Tax=Candidatus Nomurabacteria bacterium GW2011_GWA2_40_9 TaxID=1618734 RepID=A0A0G0TND6_9BACT|nr:MAG: Transcription elongation factor GreA [Candidatus Nomurabacteria bacterium GW2011_GWA2_40_9]
MDKELDYITEEKKKELTLELADLKGPKRKEIIEALEYAKSLGDLSENAEYHQAREDQGKIEARIQSIEQILQNSKVVIPAGGDVIEVGSKLVVRKEDSKEELKYVIVGYQEANITEGKISNRSPFGQALYGKKKGDSISFETPRGIVNYKIISVS